MRELPRSERCLLPKKCWARKIAGARDPAALGDPLTSRIDGLEFPVYRWRPPNVRGNILTGLEQPRRTRRLRLGSAWLAAAAFDWRVLSDGATRYFFAQGFVERDSFILIHRRQRT